MRRAEIRAAAGRRLVGTAMPYGAEARARAPDGALVRESFMPGAFAAYLASGRPTALNLAHDRSIEVARTGDPGPIGRLELRDGPAALNLVATLPTGRVFDDVLGMVDRSELAGVSVEFHAEAERREADRRIVEAAALPAIGIVTAGAYSGRVEVRQGGQRIAGTVPTGRRLGCRCQGPTCNAVEFAPGSFEVAPGALVVLRNYGRPIASRRRDTLRIDSDADLAAEFDIDPDSEVYRTLLEMIAAAPTYLRPILDTDLSEYEQTGDLRVFRRAVVRSLVVGPSDADEGLEELVMNAGEQRAAPPTEQPAPEPRRRLWL